MSRLRLSSVAAPVNPASGKCEFYYDSTGIGTPAGVGLVAVDSSGNQINIGHFTTLDYRIISVRILTSATSYVPTFKSFNILK